MDVKEAIKAIDDLVFAKQGRWLEQPEKIVLESAWLNLDYKEIVETGLYDINLLQRRVAPKLWVLLTGILGNGQKVTKKRLRHIVEKQMILADSKSASSSGTTSTGFPLLGAGLPEIPEFYGRTPEMAMLKELSAQERCIALIGTAGIGKSALVAKLVEVMRVGSLEFNGFIWMSVSYGPLLPDLVADILKLLSNSENQQPDLPQSAQAQVLMLLEQLQSRRYLIVLDGAEALLQGDRNTNSNPYGKKYADYGTFFAMMIQKHHQSCLVLTSREPFIDITRLQQKGQPVRTVKLEGLGKEVLQLFRAQGLADEDQWGELIQTYRGNPLSLQMVSSKIKNFFGGSVKEFLKFKTILMADIFEESLDELFKNKGRLTILEKKIMFHLAEELTQDSSSLIVLNRLLNKIKEEHQDGVTTSDILEALEALNERSLIEQKTNDCGEVLLSLQPQVKKYICTYALRTVKNTG